MSAAPKDGEDQRPAVFLHDFVDVARPYETLVPRFCRDGTWLAPLASRATEDGQTVFIRARPTAGTGRLGLEVRVRLGACTERGDGSFVAIRWEAARLTPLFPVLDGNLELAPLGTDRCRLVLEGSYRPPLDGFGRLLDAALLHRVAESTVRSFLLQVASTLESPETQ